MRTLLSILATASLLGACVGDLSQDPGPTAPVVNPSTGDDGQDPSSNPAGGDLTIAKAAYDADVHPIMNAKCSGGSCHSQTATGTTLLRFVATQSTDGWAMTVGSQALVANFASTAAPVLTYISPGNHKGVTYTATEVTKITGWLDKELAARATGNPNPVPVPVGQESLSQATERVLSAFAGCMDISDFQVTTMAQAWGNMNAENNQQCENCHSTGGEGYIATQDEGLFFTVISTKKYFFLQYFTVDLTMGAGAARVVTNKTSFAGVGLGLAPHTEHPRFNPTQNTGVNALNAFYTRTMARTTATPAVCTPKPLQNN